MKLLPPSTKAPDAQNRFLTPEELAERWRVSIETLKRRRRTGSLPFHKMGRGVRFSLSDVVTYEEQSRV